MNDTCVVCARFLPSLRITLLMSAGRSPKDACDDVIDLIAKKYPDFSGAVIALRNDGEHAGACYGFGKFEYSLSSDNVASRVVDVPCTPKL